jgi:hypothetical protein
VEEVVAGAAETVAEAAPAAEATPEA